ncbi:MAG: AsnC family transcriptional regulator [Pelagibacterium sp. SCN 64-44]|nr:MAG: AsnC family transcriptional regulator [Pelagibacterium sp. SCN 64-44]
MQLDKTNKRILALLEKNARISATAIGKEIGLSRPAVQDRISAMEQAGVIQGYHAATDDAAGLVRAAVFISIAERPCDRALSWLASLDGVTSVLSLAGEFDALVLVALPSASDLSAMNDRIATSPLIATAKSQVVLRHYRGGA